MHACLPFMWPATAGLWVNLPPGSSRQSRLRTPAAVTAADLYRSAPLRSARHGSLPLLLCESARLQLVRARRGRRRVTSRQYCTRRLVVWGGKASCALPGSQRLKAERVNTLNVHLSYVITCHDIWHVRRDAAQNRLQYVKTYPCNKRGKNDPVEMFLEFKVCTEVQRNGRRLSNIFGKCQ